MLVPGNDEWLAFAAGGHKPASEFLLSKSKNKMALAGRQSGKSWAVVCAMIDQCFRQPFSQCLYMTFSAAAAERTTWRLALEILRKYELEDQCKIVDRKQTIEFDNRSIISMLGADDIAHMETFRGGKSNMIVVDEVGAQPTRILQPLIDEILEPQLRATDGPLLVIGTPPRKRCGWFAEQWHGENAWTKFHWTGESNVHIAEPFIDFVTRVAERRGITLTHPSIRREYFAEWADDLSSSVLSAYGDASVYDPAREFLLGNLSRGWTTTIAPNELCAIGIDPGSRDRLAVELVAWTLVEPRDVRHAGEWVSQRDAYSTVSTMVDAVNQMRKRVGDCPVYVDPSSRMSIDTLGHDYGLAAIEAARKQDRQGQLDRLNDLLATKRLTIARGSALDEDCRLTEWQDSKADPTAYRHYTAAHHPDALDAFRYGLHATYLPPAAAPETRLRHGPREPMTPRAVLLR